MFKSTLPRTLTYDVAMFDFARDETPSYVETAPSFPPEPHEGGAAGSRGAGGCFRP